MSARVRRSPFAGTWYPGEPRALRALVEDLLDEGDPVALDGALVGIVAPHAGLGYSGPVAAGVYRLLRSGAFDTVVLLGPSHRVFFDALAVYPGGQFETPLGTVDVDEELAHALLEHSERFQSMPEVHTDEHCLEMQLPFLQVVLPAARVVPVMMGHQSVELQQTATRALVDAVSAAERTVLLVASSDLSHYENRARARALDERVLACLREFRPEALRDALAANPRHACGGGPIVSIMAAARALGGDCATVVDYRDSGAVTGDTSAVVGYVAAAFCDRDRAP